jgi:hypothetical protein
MEDMESAVSASATELQRQLTDLLKQLSPERLKVLADFAAYLVDGSGSSVTVAQASCLLAVETTALRNGC